MIIVKGWHGNLNAELSKVMDEIAMPIKPNNEWEFEGSVGDFAEKWQRHFIAYPIDEPSKIHYPRYEIFITQHGSFSAR